MEKLRQQLFILHALILIVTGLVGWYVLNAYFPNYAFVWYPVIPSFFLIFGFFSINSLGKKNSENPRKSVNIFMLLRLSKYLLSFTLLLVYYFVNGKENFKVFALTFAIFYFLYLGLETFSFYRTEKELKKQL